MIIIITISIENSYASASLTLCYYIINMLFVCIWIIRYIIRTHYWYKVFNYHVSSLSCLTYYVYTNTNSNLSVSVGNMNNLAIVSWVYKNSVCTKNIYGIGNTWNAEYMCTWVVCYTESVTCTRKCNKVYMKHDSG